MIARASAVAFATCALIACGDDDAPPNDSGAPDAIVDSAADTAVVVPTVDRPAMPVLTPCPAGWREVAGGEGRPAHCAPYDEMGPDDCPLGEAHFPGGPGCEPIGDPCPSDGFAPDLPASDVVFVRADAAPGGDGSRGAPFTDVATALAVVVPGGTIAVAPGTYGPLRIVSPVSIVGACIDVVFTSSERLPTIDVAATGVAIRNVRITGSPNGLTIRNGSLDVRGLLIDRVTGSALDALGSEITASGVKVFDVVDGGISSFNASTVTLDRIALVDVGNDSIRMSGSNATITDAVIIRSADGQHFFSTGPGGAVFERTAFFGPGTFIGINDADIELRDVVIEGPPEDVSTLPGAIAAFEGGSLTMERVRVERARTLGAAVADPGGVLTMSDVIIDDTLGANGGETGHGIELGTEATGTLTRVWVERARAVGILAAGGAAMEAADVTVIDTLPEASGTLGRALQIQTGASFVGRRIEGRGNHEVAIVVAGTDALADLTDLVLADTLPRTCATCAGAGIGLGAYLNGAISVQRFAIRDNALAGVQIAIEGEVDLVDGEVASNPVGVNIQVPGYDVARLTESVHFRENGVNLDSSDLPVPDPTIAR